MAVEKRNGLKIFACIIPLIILYIIPLTLNMGFPKYGVIFLTYIFLYATLAQAWNIIGGLTGYVLFGSNFYFGLGAYVTALLIINYNLPTLLTALIGAVIVAAVSVVIGLPTLRLRGPYFSIACIAVSVAFGQFVMSERWLTMGARGIPNIRDPLIPADYRVEFFYLIFLSLMTLATLLIWKIKNSKIGFGLLAIKQNEDAAPVLGVNTTKLKVLCFLVSAVFTSISGAFYAPFITWINPDTVLSADLNLSPILMTIFGGSGTVFGPLIGTVVLETIKRYVCYVLLPGSPLYLLPYGIVMAFIIIYQPSGIMGVINNVTKGVRRHLTAS